MSFYVSWPPGLTWARAARSLNIVVLAEGFFPHREGVFLQYVDGFTRHLLRTRPFHRFKDLLTVSAVFEAATVSLAHLLTESQACAWRDGPEGQDDHAELLNTPYGALYCRGRDYAHQLMPRALYGNAGKVQTAILTVPQLAGVRTHAVVLVDNDQVSGGAAGGFDPVVSQVEPRVAWLSMTGNWMDTAIHELGHSVFGLADEYDYDGPPSHPPVEPSASNVTLAAQREDLLTQWRLHRDKPSLRIWHSLMPASVPAPTTLPNPGCETQGSQLAKVDLAEGAVGLFEGADYSPCNIYRPRLRCRMRRHGDEFCPICEWTIDAQFARLAGPLRQVSGATVPGAWTYLLSYYELPTRVSPGAEQTHYLLYNAVSGAYAIHPANDATGAPDPATSAPDSQIDPGWTTLIPCEVTGVPHVVAHSLPGARLGLYEVVNVAGMPSLLLTHDSGLNGFPFTHAAIFKSRDVLHVIGYRSLDGAVEITRWTREPGAPWQIEALYGTAQDPARRWAAGYTLISAFPVDGVPHVLKHNAATGEVHVQSLDPPGLGPMTFVSRPGHWPAGATTVHAHESDGRNYLHRAAIGSYRAHDWVWPGAAGVELLFRDDESPNATLAYTFVRARNSVDFEPAFQWVVAFDSPNWLGFLHSR